jgi:hypothetical protein
MQEQMLVVGMADTPVVLVVEAGTAAAQAEAITVEEAEQVVADRVIMTLALW